MFKLEIRACNTLILLHRSVVTHRDRVVLVFDFLRAKNRPSRIGLKTCSRPADNLKLPASLTILIY